MSPALIVSVGLGGSFVQMEAVKALWVIAEMTGVGVSFQWSPKPCGKSYPRNGFAAYAVLAINNDVRTPLIVAGADHAPHSGDYTF